MIICPLCKGKKELFWHANYGPYYSEIRRGEYKLMPCFMCKGAGEVDDDYPRRVADGRRMRDERVARGETLFEAAKRMGMTPAQLSAIEHGSTKNEGDHMINCETCGLNYSELAKERNRLIESKMHYRRALYLACGNDAGKAIVFMEEAEATTELAQQSEVEQP